MKPVIKKQRYYNLLLMKDDSGVFSCRVRGFVLRFCIWSFLLLIAAGAAGIAGGLHYWEKYRHLAESHALQEKELADARMQLERLGNFKTLMAASNSTIPLPKTIAQNEEVGAARHEAVADNGAAAPGAAGPAANGASPSGQPAAGASAAGTAAGAPPAGNATAVPANNAEAAAASALAADTGSAGPAVNSEPSPLRIAAFIARPSRDRLRVRYELSTVSDQRQISGLVRYVAIFNDGARADLSPQETNENRFAISRMKVMDSSLRLPRPVKDLDKLDIFIDVDDGGRYQERFDIPK